MNTELNILKDDLSYMRSMADAGGRGSLRGNIIAVIAGGVFATASVLTWAVNAEVWRPNAWVANSIWPASMILFLAILFPMKARCARQGPKPIGNQAMLALWKGLGIGIFAFILALAAAGYAVNSGLVLYAIAPFVLTSYGIAWMVAGQVADLGWLKIVPYGAFASAIGVAALSGRPEQYLAYAAALVLLLCVPGLALARAETPRHDA